jgi:hypothetical protein
MKRQVVFLTDVQLKKLKKLSVKTGAKVSTLIRMAVAQYVKGK